MKYLSEYIAEEQTKCFERNNVFFAFSNKQFDEQKKKGIKYVSLGSGTICDKTKVESFLKEHDAIVKNGIQQDIKENGLTAIVRRELANHESEYTGEIDDTVDALADYPVTPADILRIFRDKNAILTA